MLIEVTVPLVVPVVRPLLVTASPTVGANTLLLGTPIPSINPLLSIWPGLTWAIAASTFDDVSGGAIVKSATTVVTAQLASIIPGCETSSPARALPLRPNT